MDMINSMVTWWIIGTFLSGCGTLWMQSRAEAARVKRLRDEGWDVW